MALELRKEGRTFADIARLLDYKSPQAAHFAVNSALNKTIQPVAEEVRRLELARLDVMLSGVWERARAGDEDAIKAVLKIMERRARLLGLDSPTEVNLNDRLKLPPEELTTQELADIIQYGRILASGNGHNTARRQN